VTLADQLLLILVTMAAQLQNRESQDSKHIMSFLSDPAPAHAQVIPNHNNHDTQISTAKKTTIETPVSDPVVLLGRSVYCSRAALPFAAPFVTGVLAALGSHDDAAAGARRSTVAMAAAKLILGNPDMSKTVKSQRSSWIWLLSSQNLRNPTVHHQQHRKI
jgi:hypothetical protein